MVAKNHPMGPPSTQTFRCRESARRLAELEVLTVCREKIGQVSRQQCRCFATGKQKIQNRSSRSPNAADSEPQLRLKRLGASNSHIMNRQLEAWQKSKISAIFISAEKPSTLTE
jgi:hypothetical protein